MLITETLHSKLKPFLHDKLLPICDADPHVLADYVLALLKHDLRLDQLRDKCNSQLSDFLRENTKSFVDDLFDFIQRESAPSTQPTLQEVSFSADEDQDEVAVDEGQSFRRQISVKRESTFQLSSNSKVDFGRKGTVRICRNMQKYGNCPLGDKCKFEHDLTSAAAVASAQKYSNSRELSSQSIFRFSKFSLQEDPTAKRLVVDKIPTEFCTKQGVFFYFKRFGRIMNVEVEEEFKRASVLFVNHEDAVRAFQCPEPMFGSRFVKIFWDTNQEISPETVKAYESRSLQQKSHHLEKSSPLASSHREKLLEQQRALLAHKEKLLEQQRILIEKLKCKEISEVDREELMQSLEKVTVLLSEATPMVQPDTQQRQQYRTDSVYSQNHNAKRSFSQSFGSNTGIASIPSTATSASKKKSMSIDFRPKTLLLAKLPSGKSAHDIVQLLKEWQPASDASSMLQPDGTYEIAFEERFQAEYALNCLVSTYPEMDSQVTWKS